jgi:hypothetical protein
MQDVAQSSSGTNETFGTKILVASCNLKHHSSVHHKSRHTFPRYPDFANISISGAIASTQMEGVIPRIGQNCQSIYMP